jgi:phage shock protein A
MKSEETIQRVARIITGGVHALLKTVDGASPLQCMTAALIELEKVILEIRADMRQLVSFSFMASRRLEEEKKRHKTLAKHIQCAIADGRDDVAQDAIAHQMDIELQIPVLERAIADSQGRIQALECCIQALKGKKRDMQRDVDDLQQAVYSDVETKACETLGDESPVDDALLGLHSDAIKLAELEQLARENCIRERLSALKAQ